MKYFTSLLLIIIFASVTIFGFALFNHGMDNLHKGCVASALDGTLCPQNIFAAALHHLAALQIFSSILISSSIDSLLMVGLMLLVLILIFLLSKNTLQPQLQFFPDRLRYFGLNFSLSRQKINSWLSLFEHSPSFSRRRY